VSVADADSGQVLVVDGTTARAVSAPPGRVLALTGGEAATALLRERDGTWSLWRAGLPAAPPS
jgi:hypothetical protein